uniref:Nacht and ankyrin domain protein n=1 Tax=Colletotrichum fructicola (strain Nara gc5) TaxID=1213859 RepID=L2GDQ2_COLFN
MKTVTRKQADELIQEILRKASGVFMWVVLVIDILNKDLQRGRIFAVKKRLQEIPPKLSDLFRDILTRDTENMDDLLLSLQWILFCKRPLRLEEYYFALAAGLEPESLAEWDSSQITKEVMNQFVVSSSKGLAEITKSETAAVQFIHESVRDFLLKDDGLTSLWPDLGDNPKGRSHVRLMNCCHSYTKVDVSAYVQPGEYFLEEDKSSAENLREQVAEKFPLLEYATNQLLYHADAAESLGVLQKSFLREFASSLDNWTKLHNLFEQDKISRYTQRTSPLYIFADLGFASLADNTARDSQQLPTYSSPFERFPTPLHAAVHGQHVGAVKVLIRHMTSEEINMPHRTSLFMAMPARNASIVKILLEAGADMYLRGNGGSDLFSWAIIFGLQDIVKLLLPRNFSVIASRDSDPPVYPAEDEAELLTKDGVDVNMDPLTRQISLYCAVRAGEKFTVKFLLDNGGEPDYRYEPSGRTLLHLAVSMGNKPMVLLLLENGANIDPCGCDVSPLKLALRCGAEEISKVLLEKGANLNITDDRGHTALHVAAQKGCVKLVETIVDMGADISCTDLQGSTPLSLACKNQNHDVAAFLFDRGARIEEDESSNVAHPYTEGLHKQVAQLLQLDANEINGRDELGRTPLFEACHLGALDIVKSLLERGADATVTDNQGQTALFAVQRSHVHSGLLVRVLVEARADPMRQNTMGKTFLDASYGFPTLDIRRRKHIFERVGQRLLDEGYGLFNRTLLAHAAVSNDVPEVAFLLYLGANPDMKDSQGDTILHDIVRAGYAGTRSHIICLLLEGGADAGILNADNSTPLDLARRHGNDMVSILRSTLERSHLGQTHISQVSEDNS